MNKLCRDPRELTAAQRGHIVQRVLVERLTLIEAGAPFGVGERQVAAWVRAYRRRGMASLRENPAIDLSPGRWFARIMARLVARMSASEQPIPASCIVLRRGELDAAHPAPRRSRWN